ncbi:CU044_5270 family protein [Nonomuraea sp. NPDC001831]|uniref:CU044_5270 family protein n=1 Tax=Nonomuraea sp. NPDC001831 TaxID=3364340 RepID=UPI00368D0174
MADLNQDLTLIRDLYAAPPPTPEVLADGRARLAEAYASSMDAGVRREEQRPPLRALPDGGRARRRWPLVGASLAGAAAVTVAATFLTAPSTPSTPATPVASAAPARLSAGEILLAAAGSVTPDAGDGAYWRRDGVAGRYERAPGGHYTLKTSRSIELWLPKAAGRPTWVIRQDLGAEPATPEDETAWRAAGSPRTWTLSRGTPPVKLQAGPGERDAVRDDSGKTLTLLGTPMTPATLNALPTTPEALRDTLERLVSKGYGKERVDMNAQLFETGVRLVMNFPTSPEVRAATYRMLAALPGASAESEATDPLGRKGQAVSRPAGPGERYRFVVDTATGLPLALESTIGQDRSYEAIRTAAWTDEEPRLPALRRDMNR